MTKQIQKHKICIPDSVMNNFCYPFAKALLLKLKDLEREDRIFEEGIAEIVSKEERYASSLTEIAYTVIEKMCLQFELANVGTSATPLQIKKVIDLAEEFLAIFEVK